MGSARGHRRGIQNLANGTASAVRAWPAARTSGNCVYTPRCWRARKSAKCRGDFVCCIAIPNRSLQRHSKKRWTPPRSKHFCSSAARVWRSGCGNSSAHRLRRNDRLIHLAFPFPSFRPAQRALSAEVYRTVRDGGALLFEAPTGSGKTLSALFPSLIAMGQGSTDRVVFLSSKATGPVDC